MTPPDSRSALLTRLAEAARHGVENAVTANEIDSTQAWGLRLVEQAESEEIALPPTMVIALHQHSGRGRGDRDWTSPAGGLYLSWIGAGLDASAIPRLPMVVAAVVSDSLANLGLDPVMIKWPNDILVAGGKCAGCLVHSRHGENRWAVVGVGVNIATTPGLADEPIHPPTSVFDHLAGASFADVAERLVTGIAAGLRDAVADSDAAVAAWRKRLLHTPGDAMTVRLGDGTELGGRFIGLTDEGHLRLDVDGAERIIAAGDVVES